MNEARVYAVRNRIAETLLSKDGPSADQLLMDADARVALLAESIRVFVASRVAALSTWTEQSEEALFAGCQAIAAPAMDIAEVAEAAGLEALGAVARGIWVMIDGVVRRGMWHTDALRIHLQALRLLGIGNEVSDQEGRRIVDDLAGLRRSLGFSE